MRQAHLEDKEEHGQRMHAVHILKSKPRQEGVSLG